LFNWSSLRELLQVRSGLPEVNLKDSCSTLADQVPGAFLTSNKRN